jgi:hypothetical protein
MSRGYRPLRAPRDATEHLLYEVLRGLGVLPHPWRRRLLRVMVTPPARLFAGLAARFDADAQELGFAQAARRLMSSFAPAWTSRGAENLPGAGPLLLVSNHPGTFDGLAIAAALSRNDLKFIARDMRFLRGLPAVHPHMIYSTLDTHTRMLVVRNIVRQLDEGGSVLLFPTGKLDPDPAVLPGAAEALNEWSTSLEVIMRRVPHAQVAPTIVSGLLSPTLFRLPRLRGVALPREMLVRLEILQVVLQLVFPRRFPSRPAVAFSAPVLASALLANASPREALIGHAQELLNSEFPQPLRSDAGPGLTPTALPLAGNPPGAVSA